MVECETQFRRKLSSIEFFIIPREDTRVGGHALEVTGDDHEDVEGENKQVEVSPGVTIIEVFPHANADEGKLDCEDREVAKEDAN